MSTLSNTLVAASMSADAFAAALSKGVCLHRPRLSYAVRVGIVFGSVETIAPIIGWLLGKIAGGLVASVDHWVAFFLLAAIGGKMIAEGLSSKTRECRESHRLSLLILTAIATSIDALAVGATLALLNVNIWLMAGMIGGATFLMATLGILTGHYIGTKAGKTAEVLGGICLIAIGTNILLDHLGF